MFSSIWQDIKNAFERGNTVIRIIFANAILFIFINFVNVFGWLTNKMQPSELFTKVSENLQVSSDFSYILWHPWSLITHMFLHVGFGHVFFNMLCLSWFGRITGDLLGDHRVLPIYVYSGLLGALFFILFSNYSGEHGYAMGASASVMGIALAAAFTAPDYRMNMLFIGEVALKYVVLVMLILDLFALPSGGNTGGHFAHLGGAAFGGFFVSMLQRGYDLSAGFNNLQHWFLGLFKNFGKKKPKERPKPRVVYRNTDENLRKNQSRPSSPDAVSQSVVDSILDKIKREGYSNLTAEEKETLMKASKK
jgi:membrane associated rhomboid family serine protease